MKFNYERVDREADQMIMLGDDQKTIEIILRLLRAGYGIDEGKLNLVKHQMGCALMYGGHKAECDCGAKSKDKK